MNLVKKKVQPWKKNGTLRILEIGAAQMPLHNRGDQFSLGKNEELTVLDINPSLYDTKLWQGIKKDYGDRIKIVEGSLENIPKPQELYDEVVSSGSTIPQNRETFIIQASNVLKKGGKLIFGTPVANQFLKDWQPILEKHGFKYVGAERQVYDFSKRREQRIGKTLPEGNDYSYEALTFEKL